jgi:hypothetical protein
MIPYRCPLAEARVGVRLPFEGVVNEQIRRRPQPAHRIV